MQKIRVGVENQPYDIWVGNGLLDKASDWLAPDGGGPGGGSGAIAGAGWAVGDGAAAGRPGVAAGAPAGTAEADG